MLVSLVFDLKPRGFGVVAYYFKKILESKGHNIILTSIFNPDISVLEKSNRIIVISDWYTGQLFASQYVKYKDKLIGHLVTEGSILPSTFNYRRILVPSKFVQEQFKKIGVDTVLVPQGIDTKLFRPQLTPKFYDALAIGIVESENDKRKNLDIAGKVQEILGDKYKVHIHSKPTFDYESLPLLYNASRIYLALSGSEGFDIPALEAMSCGIPVIYSEADVHLEVLTGLVAKTEKVEEKVLGPWKFQNKIPSANDVAEKIKQLLTDKTLYEKLSRDSRNRALKHDYRKTYANIEELIE